MKVDAMGVGIGSHRRMHLNACSEVGGTIWEELGGVELLEEVYYLRVSLRLPKPMPPSVSLFACGLWVRM